MFKESASLIKKRSYQYFLLRVEEKGTFNPFLSQKCPIFVPIFPF